MRTMYDSVTAHDIPTSAHMVAGYVDGRYKWSAADWSRFPHAMKVKIAVSASTNNGNVLDCESGDATPAQCPGWIKMRQKAGLARPTIYCNHSTMAAVQHACSGLHYALWIAEWNGHAHSISGAAAVQYADPGHGSGGHYDLSAVYDDSWHPG